MAEHKHGEMDITTQVATFNGFIKFTTWALVVIFIIVMFLAIFWS